jgi:hypothetical protein
MVAVDDIGALVAMAFARPGKWQGRTYELAGDELYGRTAQVFSKASREVRYNQVPWDEFEKQAGKEITVMYRWFQETGYHVDIQAVRQEYPSLMTLGRWMNSYWNTAVQTAG